jgi:hypothetical protein
VLIRNVHNLTPSPLKHRATSFIHVECYDPQGLPITAIQQVLDNRR